jgi:hypothetical protein
MNRENEKEKNEGKTWVPGPQEFYLEGNCVLGVWLADDEEVHWQLNHTPDGRSLVTGYTITKKSEKEDVKS